VSISTTRWLKRARLFGNVIEAVVANKYYVLLDNAVQLECFSNSLCLDLAIPPVLPAHGGNLHTQAENEAVL
jgi:hypothetical protein